MNARRKPSSSSHKSRNRPRGKPRGAPAEKSPAQIAADDRARRVKNCAGAKPCFDARWLAMPEPRRQWRSDWLEELYRSKDFDKAIAHANARAAERQRNAQLVMLAGAARAASGG